MRLLAWLSQDAQEPAVLNHAPVNTKTECAYYDALRRDKLHRAAERYGKPFKCAQRGLPREVYVTPTTVKVKA